MKKHLKKLALRKEVVRDLALPALQRVAGGISGLHDCNTLQAKCGGNTTTTSGATCESAGAGCESGPASICAFC
jgi:hypothetical protein